MKNKKIFPHVRYLMSNTPPVFTFGKWEPQPPQPKDSFPHFVKKTTPTGTTVVPNEAHVCGPPLEVFVKIFDDLREHVPVDQRNKTKVQISTTCGLTSVIFHLPNNTLLSGSASFSRPDNTWNFWLPKDISKDSTIESFFHNKS